MMNFINNEKNFSDSLIRWFKIAQRPMPWRLTKDPYSIMVSEFMLQQTQVATVIPYYLRFIELFPTLNHLARADENQVLAAWAGLGYYSRARNLQKACQQILEKHQGIFPTRYEDIRALSGVGDYTVGAIMSIAYGIPVPAVDGNVMRVFSRLLSSELDIASEKTKQYWRTQIATWMPNHDVSEYTQGLMELGATVCTPLRPQCEHCPVSAYCSAYHSNRIDDFPVKSKKVATKSFYYDVYLIIDDDNYVWVEQREAAGLLAGQWQLPMKQVIPGDDFVTDYKHQFSHQVWHLRIVRDFAALPKESLQKVALDEIQPKLIVAHQRLIKGLKL